MIQAFFILQKYLFSVLIILWHFAIFQMSLVWIQSSIFKSYSTKLYYLEQKIVSLMRGLKLCKKVVRWNSLKLSFFVIFLFCVTEHRCHPITFHHIPIYFTNERILAKSMSQSVSWVISIFTMEGSVIFFPLNCLNHRFVLNIWLTTNGLFQKDNYV